jgi:hypothetical protein
METSAATRLVTSGPGPSPAILPAGRGFPRSKEGAGSTKRRSVRNEPNFARPAGKMRRTNQNVEILGHMGKGGHVDRASAGE